VDHTPTRGDRRSLVGNNKYTFAVNVIAGARQRFDIAGRSIGSGFSVCTLCNPFRDRRPEAILLLIPLLERLNSMVPSNAVSASAMQREQFVRMTNDVVAICPSLTPPMQHRHLSAIRWCGERRLPWLLARVRRPNCAAWIG
jgi:hypothetical protein